MLGQEEVCPLQSKESQHRTARKTQKGFPHEVGIEMSGLNIISKISDHPVVLVVVTTTSSASLRVLTF